MLRDLSWTWNRASQMQTIYEGHWLAQSRSICQTLSSTMNVLRFRVKKIAFEP